jgi:hypothetical protein
MREHYATVRLRGAGIWLVARICRGQGNDRLRVAGRNFAVHRNSGAGHGDRLDSGPGAPGRRSPVSRRPDLHGARQPHTGSVTQRRETGFTPSAHGFAFSNEWPPAPAIRVRVGVGSLGIGNAARGLCGGMVFAALDYWHAGVAPPAERPAAGAPLFRFIVRRLVDSWRLPAGVARYYRWMLLPDGDSRARARIRPGVASRTTRLHWPAIKGLLDAGVPATLGVVTVSSPNPLLLGGNHQVLTYGYEIEGTQVALQVYDPNAGPDDEVRIWFDTAAETAEFTGNLGLPLPVRGFFLTRYSPARLPGLVRAPRLRGRRAAGTPSC